MNKLSDAILNKINPRLGFSNFSEVENDLNNPECLTLCLRSTFQFIKEKIHSIQEREISGDIVLVGVWRGGLAMYIQSLLYELGETSRKLHLSDTFSGFLPVSENHPDDKIMYDYFCTLNAPSGSEFEIINNVKSWGLPTSNLVFHKGDVGERMKNFFTPTALLIIDVDFYEPTINALKNLYQNVVNGGITYIDDYGVENYGCKRAVELFRNKSRISEKINFVNEFGVYWEKLNLTAAYQ